jgi:hypothetical protein
MIQIAALNQTDSCLTNLKVSRSLERAMPGRKQKNFHAKKDVAFVGYAVWRREENGDANLSDEQVLVVRDGQVRFLDPRSTLENHSPDGFSWGYPGSAAAQLALAMLMEIFDDWERVRPLYPLFQDKFVQRIPQYTNWTADGLDVLAIALSIEESLRSRSALSRQTGETH